MTIPTGSPENESALSVKLAQASILALGQSLLPDAAVPGETPFVLLPSMVPYVYDELADVLAPQKQPMVLYGFRALGAILIGKWTASENLQLFEWQAVGISV